MSAGSVTAAMTRPGPTQRGQYLKSIASTRRQRCIQVMGWWAVIQWRARRGRALGTRIGCRQCGGDVSHWLEFVAQPIIPLTRIDLDQRALLYAYPLLAVGKPYAANLKNPGKADE
jgi:hypothetical protein